MSAFPRAASGEHTEITRVPQTLCTGWKLWSTTNFTKSGFLLKVNIEVVMPVGGVKAEASLNLPSESPGAYLTPPPEFLTLHNWSAKSAGGFVFLTNSQVKRMSRSESYTLRTVALKLDYRDVSHASSPTARTLRTSLERLLPIRPKVCLESASLCIYKQVHK